MRFVILSRQSGGGSAEKLVEAFEAEGHEALLINTLQLALRIETGSLTRFHRDKPLTEIDGVLARIGHGVTAHGVAVLRQFELAGVPTFPSSAALLRSRQKLEALQHLAAANIAVPKTVYVHRVKELDHALDRLSDAPLIVKVLQGTGGQGVVLAETRLSAKAIAAALISAGKPVLLQEFVEEARGRDVRVVVVGDEVIGAVSRVAQGDEYRSNVHLGAMPTVVDPPDELKKVAIRAAKVLGLEVAGVDILEGNDGPLVLEVNSSPGLVDFQKVIGRDVSRLVAQHIIRQVGDKAPQAKETTEATLGQGEQPSEPAGGQALSAPSDDDPSAKAAQSE